MDSSRIGSLRVDFLAQNAQFVRATQQNAEAMRRQQRAVNALKRDVRAFNRTAQAMARRLISLRSAATVLSGGGGLGLLVRRNIEAADRIAKTADAIGISTDALQELRFAADRSGVSVEAMDSALTAFSKRVGEARNGTGTLITLLRNMDPALLANVQAAQSVGEAFALITSRARGMENTLDRNALLAAAFGRTAGPAMARLAGDIEELRKEARALGIVIEEDLLRGAERTQDQFTNLEHILRARLTAAIVENAEEIDGFVRALTESLPQAIDQAIPFFKKLIDNLGRIAILLAALKGGLAGARFAGAIGAIAGGATAAIGTAIGINLIADQFKTEREKIEEELERLSRNDGSFGFGLSDAYRARETKLLRRLDVLNLQEGLEREALARSAPPRAGRDLIPAVLPPQEIVVPDPLTRDIYDEIADQEAERDKRAAHELKLLGLQGEALARQQGIFEATALIRRKGVELDKQLTSARSAYNSAVASGNVEMIQSSKKQLDLAQKMSMAFLHQSQDVELLSAGLQKAAVQAHRLAAVRDLFTQRLTPLELYNEQLQVLNGLLQEGEISYELYAHAIENAQQRLAETSEAGRRARQAAESIGRAFEDLALNAITNFKNIGDAARNLARTLVNDLLRVLILSPIRQAIVGGIANFLTPAPASGAAPGSFRYAQDIGLPGRQLGGFTPPGLAWVGEAGRELVDFERPGRVYSNETLRQAMSGPGAALRPPAPVINVSVNAEAGVSRDEVRGYVVEGMGLAVAEARASIGADLGRPSGLRATARRR